jgi:aspartyl protease family protein
MPIAFRVAILILPTHQCDREATRAACAERIGDLRRLLWILLALSTVVLLILVMRQNERAWTELTSFESSGLESKIMALALIAMIAFVMFRQRFTHVIESILIWIMLAILLGLGYTYRFELRDVADRVLAELFPGRTVSRGQTVEIVRGRGGSFSVATRVNGVRVSMVVDTGASAVVLTQEAARAVGLPLEVLNYSVSVETANGRTRAAPVTLDRVAVGAITERAVPALIAQPGQLRSNLLGMSFLNRLERWEVRGDRLVMRGSP